MIVLWEPKQQFRTKLAARVGDGEIHEAASAEQVYEAIASNAQSATVVIGPSVESKIALDFTAGLKSIAHDVGVVLVRSKPSPAFVRSAKRSGVRDVVPTTSTGAHLDRAVRRALEQAGAATKGEGRIITVFAAKGGCGKSFIAANLSVLLARTAPGQVALVDLDFDSGDQQIMFRLFGGQTFLDVVDDLDRLDAESVRSRLARHDSGVHLLAAPPLPGLAEKIATDHMHRVLTMLRSAYRYVVVDGPTSYTDQLLAAIDVTDECVLVTSMEVPAVKALKVALQTLDALGFDPKRIRVVLNRADSDVGLRHKEIEKAVSRKIDHHIPSTRDVPVSINRGSPVSIGNPRSKVIAPISELATKIAGPAPRRSEAEGQKARHRRATSRKEKSR